MILCCGEALIDMIPAPLPCGQSGFVPHSGGALFNSAIGLGRLGARVGMLTALSRDMFGQQLIRDLAQAHVDTAHIIRTDRPSTLAFVQITDGQAEYAFFDENTAERMLQPADVPALDGAVEALFFGGISLAREPGARAYADLAARAHDRHVVMLDPNIRAGFITDEAAFRARMGAMLALADIVKVSDEDLAWLCREETGFDAQVAWLRAAGPSVVIVTRGAEGATAWLADGATVTVPAIAAEVVDTVGAGDTFNAGVLARLQEAGQLKKSALRALTPDDLRAALVLGARVAAVTVSRAGANPPWRDELP